MSSYHLEIEGQFQFENKLSIKHNFPGMHAKGPLVDLLDDSNSNP